MTKESLLSSLKGQQELDWIASMHSTVIFLFHILKFWLISYLHLSDCCLRYVNIFYEYYV